MGTMRVGQAVACATGILLSASVTFAQARSAESASAEALFEAGKALLDDGKVAEACPKLEESLKLEDAIGTRFQLARCFEALGRSASAWSLYLDVVAKAKASGQGDRESFARAEAARLKPGLSKLTIVVPAEARVPGLEITRNGAAVGSGQWDLALPVDPGDIQITAQAPGKTRFSGSVTVHGTGGVEIFRLPRLEDAVPGEAAVGSAAGSTREGPPQGLSSLQWAGIAVGGVGVASVGIAGLFALNAKSKDKNSGCVNGACPDSDAQTLNGEARAAGNVATLFVIAGGVLVAAGVTLVLVGPARQGAEAGKPSARLEPILGTGFAGARIGGSF